MVVLSLQTRSIGRTLCRFKNFKLRFRYWIAPAIYPRKCVVSFVGANICEDAGWFEFSWLMRPSRENDGWKPCDGLLQSRIFVDGILPNLISVRGQIDFRLSVTVKDTGFLVIQIHDCLIVLIILK